VELRQEFGFTSDIETVRQAAVDRMNYPVLTYEIPMSVAEGDEVARRIRVQLSLDEAIAYGEADPQWGGVWIDQSAGGEPVFQFTQPTSGRDSALGALLPPGTKFRVVYVDTSYAKLQEERTEIVDDLDALANDGMEVNGVGIDLPGNRVRLTVSKLTPDIDSSLRARYGDRLTIVNGESAVSDFCPVDGCLPVKGGIGIVGKTSGWPCTLGYLARRTDVNPDTLVMVTAGHCVHLGSSSSVAWHHGTTNLGYGLLSPNPSLSGQWIHTWYDYADADVGLISVLAAQVPPVYRNQALVDDSPVTVRSITETRAWNLQTVGSFVCRMGRTTFLQCGFISDNDETKLSTVTGYGSMHIDHTVVYGRDANGGDSGGLMFVRVDEPGGPSYAVLYGTHVHSQDGYVTTGGVAWYSPVDRGITQLQSRHAPLTLNACITASCGLP
jgi:hypothetical protein